jgi:hypothetical protein
MSFSMFLWNIGECISYNIKRHTVITSLGRLIRGDHCVGDFEFMFNYLMSSIGMSSYFIHNNFVLIRSLTERAEKMRLLMSLTHKVEKCVTTVTCDFSIYFNYHSFNDKFVPPWLPVPPSVTVSFRQCLPVLEGHLVVTVVSRAPVDYEKLPNATPSYAWCNYKTNLVKQHKQIY